MHSGFGGPLEEVCLQALGLQETRLALENTPKVGIGGESCVAWSPALVDEALATGAFRGFVLDIGHALYASASASTAWELFLAEFLCMSPDLFHLSDGYMGLDKDIHESIGKGTFDLKRILAMIPPDAAVTLETPRDMDHGLNDSIHDALEVRRLVSLLS